MNNVLNIPPHTHCKNCGECCGPVLITREEEKRIIDFISATDKQYLDELRSQNREYLDCQFRDIVNGKCAIYEVRPLICRLFGVVEGMHCKYGNSDFIDGSKFVDTNNPVKFMRIKY